MSDNVTFITPGIQPSYQQSPCTLAPIPLETYPALQPSTASSPTLAAEVVSTLFDDNFDTCMRPFQLHSMLRLAIGTRNMKGSSLLRFNITGEGLDCVQPSTLIYLDLANAGETEALQLNINKQECPCIESSPNAGLMTCIYECRSIVPMRGSVPFGVEFQRLSWLTWSQHLEQLCDIRAFVWI